ncbi:TPA: hypothetical protein ACYLN4_000634 [Burkholderia lata]
MKFAVQMLPDGKSQVVDASGKPLGSADADRPILHILPKLFVPSEVLAHSPGAYDGVECDSVSLEVTSTLPVVVVPDGGAVVRQPYPNRQYFVGGAPLIRNGWIVPLPLETVEFDIEFHWRLEGPGVWRTLRQDEWEVRHVIHVRLHPGKGMTYSMDSACWPDRHVPAQRFSPVTPLGIGEEDRKERRGRQIARACDLVYLEGDQKGELAGFFLEECVDITGVPLAQAWSMDAFQDEQLHEVEQTAVLAECNEAHRANGPIEMPAEIFVRAVELAQQVPFDSESDFARSVSGVPGGMERHPAMRVLCDWWETVRPAGEPFRPGSAMPMIRVRDDGEYWWGHAEIPNAPVEDFNPSGRDVARIGNFMLILFQATQEVATFDAEGMHIFLPSGEPYNTIGIAKEDYTTGASDEAWYCLNALASFRTRFTAAWKFLNKTGSEYRAARRAEVARLVPLPEGTRSCGSCHGLPILTEDPTGESRVPFLLECGDHVTISGDSIERVLESWNDDSDCPDFIQVSAKTPTPL